MTGMRHFPGFRSLPMLLLGSMLVLGLCLSLGRYLVLAPADYPFPSQREVYAAKQSILLLHVGGGIAAMVLGLVQFACLRWRQAAFVHRTLGAAYAVAVLVAAGAGLELSTSALQGAPTGVAFATLAVLWAVSTTLAVCKAIAGDRRGHRRWIVRSYALTLSALTMRTQLGLLIYLGGLSVADAYVIAAWGGWVMNLVLVEWATVPDERSAHLAQNRRRSGQNSRAPDRESRSFAYGVD